MEIGAKKHGALSRLAGTVENGLAAALPLARALREPTADLG
jgi:hypothetical protein